MWVVFALLLCLISMIGASLIQTSGGKITIKELSWESPSGHQLSALLYKPRIASKDNPLPAIVTIEGWYNNKEMQDLTSIEYARRGYVVLCLDMASHGNSESLSVSELYDGAVGVDGAVQLVASLPYVDSSRIGVTGHSSGGTGSNMAIEIDNERDIPLIKANFLQAGDWQDDLGNDHSGDFGNRSIGIIASHHDDFYFWTYNDDGTEKTSPSEFITTDGAKKFLNFNEDISTFKGDAVPGKYYEKNIDGVDSYRVIYTPNMIHPLVPFSRQNVGYGIDFFEESLGAPNPISSAYQIWQWKTMFNILGLIGLIIFMVNFTLVMLNTRYFESLSSVDLVKPQAPPTGKRKIWFWGSLAVSAFFSGWSFLFVMRKLYPTTTNLFPQTGPLELGVWSVLSGLFSVIIMAVGYFIFEKKNGFSFKERGVIISAKSLGKTALLSLMVISASFGIVFFANYFFKTDFRLWVIAVKAFEADKVLIALRYLPLFLLFYVVNSIAINCFNYNEIAKKEWVNIATLGLFNSLGAIFIVAIQYITFFRTDVLYWYMTEGDRMGPIWMMPIIVILFVAAVISRKIYKRTNNPYLAGFINAMFITMITCSNTTTLLGAAKLICTAF